ncbi:MAG: alpha-galactosidase [Clostridiales bacterium]|nr:alpha-galactosidase [Clostridiales bacterium]
MIRFHEDKKVFQLDTTNSTYLLAIVEDEFLAQAYYGEKLAEPITYTLRLDEAPFTPSQNNRDRVSFYDVLPMAYPTHGIGDFREDCLNICSKAGHSVVKLAYQSYEITTGKPKLKGLPATFADDDQAQTLTIKMVDQAIGAEVELAYSVFSDTDAIASSVKVRNASKDTLWLEKILSGCLELPAGQYDMLSLHGSWARERHVERREIGFGYQGVYSKRGSSGHQDHPFIAVLEPNASQASGHVYGMHFVYSGNYMAQVEKNQFDSVRCVMGIHPEDFSFKLEQGETFQAPEMIRVFSATGLDGMTHALHDLYRSHLIRSPYLHQKRPILINNWEATYFDFDADKLLSIAKEASSLGIEMLVMDDGWFGKRTSDNMSLGDWVVTESKFPDGLCGLVDKVNELGMKFGIWFEPEMISPDSDLYRAHPEWAIAVAGSTAGLSRNQYVLDFSREDVVEHIYQKLSKVLHSANIAYVKWDMNRPMADLASANLPADQQGELSHRYILGVYQLQERLITEFPYLLLENCAGGGGRFDPGMLYYSPQIWCSDDTDAIERLAIQEGTALIYPLSTMGAHVSDCPNHTVGRNTPFETRGHVALMGTFGYELDVNRIPDSDKAMIPQQVALYHQYADLIREGRYYRIASFRETHWYDAAMVVSPDQKEALIIYVQVLAKANAKRNKIHLRGLAENMRYAVANENFSALGSTLMRAGLLVNDVHGDFCSRLIHLKSV